MTAQPYIVTAPDGAETAVTARSPLEAVVAAITPGSGLVAAPRGHDHDLPRWEVRFPRWELPAWLFVVRPLFPPS